MRKIIVLFVVVLGGMVNSSIILSKITPDTNVYSKNIYCEQVAKVPSKCSANIIWFIG